MRINRIWGRLLVCPLFVLAGCTSEAIVAEALTANNPGLTVAPPGEPPVPPESLTITPTGMSPVSTTAVAPDPILPTMDRVYKTRRLPPGVRPMPAQRPSQHEGEPEERYQPEREEIEP